MFYESVPDFMDLAVANYQGHRARLDEFHARGVLLMAGPLTEPAGNAIGVFTTKEAVEEFVAGDPFVLNGVVAKVTISEWMEVLAE
jgi:uncharacterized protein YciI